MSLTNKEHEQLRTLIEKANILWQYYEKDDLAQDLTDKQWNEFIGLYQDNFCDGAFYVADELLDVYKYDLKNKENKNDR